MERRIGRSGRSWRSGKAGGYDRKITYWQLRLEVSEGRMGEEAGARR